MVLLTKNAQINSKLIDYMVSLCYHAMQNSLKDMALCHTEYTKGDSQAY